MVALPLIHSIHSHHSHHSDFKWVQSGLSFGGCDLDPAGKTLQLPWSFPHGKSTRWPPERDCEALGVVHMW